MQNCLALAHKIRLHVLRMTQRAGSSHIGTNYSMCELLAALYGNILRLDPSRPTWSERDRFVLSKGHGCASLYAVLAESGFFPVEWLETFYLDGSRLAGHITHVDVPGVEVSTGSLGHGLSIAAGMALVGKRDQESYRVFVMLSDGECDEGSTWEPILFAPQHQLDNLVAIVDFNKIQSLGSVSDVMELEPFADKWRAFGWAVREIDGHNLDEINSTLSSLPFEPDRPSCVIAHTIKGKGVSFMENKLLWHYRSPQGEEFAAALAELEAQG
ncbi:MAG TPA: transketolase [Pyrinomonadaceae bacterium]|nr:transketolase [Pyrinomonadaceae bacterium]